jgi:exopolyphosphatase/guanosine-5'-triphosphate,3'-diphosphate pyrophosphatase
VPSNADELRLAAIDVGSNSIHMVVAQIDSDGGVTVLWRLKEMLGLGRMSFPSHRLSYEAMDRAIVTLRRFCQEAQRRQCEQILAVATSAVRESENGGDFIERVRQELGLHVRVVSAKDEARLIYLGVRQEIGLLGGPHLLLDIGGGSVEFIVADKERPLLLESRKLGAARMTARYVKSDPIDASELKSLLSHYDAELTPLVEQIRALKPARVIGTSGTIENLAAMCNARSSSNGHEPMIIQRPAIQKLAQELLESCSEDRARMKGLDDKRKDQIVAGAILAAELFERLDLKQIEVCRSALREGLVIDYLARHRPELQVRRQVPDPRRRAIVDLARRCHWQQEHSEQVARLCVRLFDQLKPVHGLGRRPRELIEYGALLHDIGSLIGTPRHHKHSMYLILNGNLQPFSKDETRIIANIARYHRKARPKNSHKLYAQLSEKGKFIVRAGAAILRIADGLDRTNCAVVADLRCRIRRRRVDVAIETRADPELELWSARARSGLFAQVFERTVAFSEKRG